MTEAANDIQLAAFFIGKSKGRLIVHLGVWIRIDSLRGGGGTSFLRPNVGHTSNHHLH